MKETVWIDSKTACALLGVRPQTLYAYVSRGLLRARSYGDDARRSLYARADVEAVAKRHKRPRARRRVAAQAIRWGDPVLVSSISFVRDGELFFGDRRAVDCAQTMSLEEAAAHHCRVPSFAATPAGATVSAAATPLGRALVFLAAEVELAFPMDGRSRDDLALEGASLLSGTADAILGRTCPGPIHERFRVRWRLGERATDRVRQALVLLSDHELTPSTFAVRVCASTGGSLAAALLAGLAALSGPRHGGAARVVRNALKMDCTSSEKAGDSDSALSPAAIGFGHPLYPQGDPRAAYLLELEDQRSHCLVAVEQLSRRFDRPPNIDTALAVLEDTYDLPDGASLSIFAVGRTAGWIAHAIEQSEITDVIRPRAQFEPRVPRSDA